MVALTELVAGYLGSQLPSQLRRAEVDDVDIGLVRLNEQ